MILVDLASKISHRVGRKRKELFYSIIVLRTVVFGLIICSILLTLEINSTYFKVYAYLAQKVVENDAYLSTRNDNKSNDSNQITLIGHRWAWAFSWIPKYVYQANVKLYFI